jgi:hypothetical protein
VSRRIIVTGSRHWSNQEWVEEVLSSFIDEGEDVTIVHGDCPSGADRFASIWCDVYDIKQERHPADWATYGRSAGPRRNQHMVALGADLVLAFPVLGSRGSWDCMRRAEKAGIKVYNFGEKYGK